MVLPAARYRMQKKYVSWSGIFDDFNRANTSGAAGLGPDWWHFSAWSGGVEYPIINSNTARGTGTYGYGDQGKGATWKVPVPAEITNYYVEADIVGMESYGVGMCSTGVIIRANESTDAYGSASTNEAIFCAIAGDGWRIYRHYPRSTASITLIASGTGSYSAGSKIRVEVSGNTLTFKYGTATLASGVDITGYGSGRQVGIYTNGGNARLDNFTAHPL